MDGITKRRCFYLKKEEKIIHVINQSVVDTNYIRDDKITCYSLKNVLKNWIIIYTFSNLIIYLVQKTGTVFNFNQMSWFYPLVRILYISLFILALISFIYFINKSKMSIKENDFLKLYIIIPGLLIFTKVIFPLSYYLNTDILIGLINTISLDLITLILSSLLFKFYFKDNRLNIFILYNIFIYLINIVVVFSFSSINNSSIFLITVYNFINFLQDFGFFVLAHFIFILIYMKKIIRNEEIYI